MPTDPKPKDAERIPKTVENLARVLYLTSCCKGGYIEWPGTMQYPVKEYWLLLADAGWRFMADSPVQNFNRDQPDPPEPGPHEHEHRGPLSWNNGYKAGFKDALDAKKNAVKSDPPKPDPQPDEKSSRQRVEEAIEKSRQPGTWAGLSQPDGDVVEKVARALASAWAALGDNLESRAAGGTGITKEYTHAVQREIREAEAALKREEKK